MIIIITRERNEPGGVLGEANNNDNHDDNTSSR